MEQTVPVGSGIGHVDSGTLAKAHLFRQRMELALHTHDTRDTHTTRTIRSCPQPGVDGAA
jgi:hypothetical protein